jgi:hypothetical protein
MTSAPVVPPSSPPAAPSLAICILSKDSLELIEACCASILAWCRYPDYRLYIFDTGTTEPEVLEYYARLQAQGQAQVLAVGDYQFSRNYNAGIARITEEYVLIQNNDTVALSDYVTPLMKLAMIGSVGVCGPRMLYPDGLIQHDGQVLFDAAGGVSAAPTHRNKRKDPRATAGGRAVVDGITAAGLLIERALFLRVGGFDEGYADIYQDVDFNLRIAALGLSAVCDGGAVIRHLDNFSRKKLLVSDELQLRKQRDRLRLTGKFPHHKREDLQPALDWTFFRFTAPGEPGCDHVLDRAGRWELVPIRWNAAFSSRHEAEELALAVGRGATRALLPDGFPCDPRELANLRHQLGGCTPSGATSVRDTSGRAFVLSVEGPAPINAQTSAMQPARSGQ